MGNVIMIVVGFVLLVWGADRFVEGASTLAKKLGIPSVIIGLTVVAFGTSAPELAVSVIAGLQGANEIAIGNVLGSNIFNLLVVIGSSAIVAPLVIDKELLNGDWMITIGATTLLGVLLALGWELSRIDAMILLVAFAFVIGNQIKNGMRIKAQGENSEDNNFVQEQKMVSSYRMLFGILAGLVAIILGGQLAVTGATELARMLLISETIIGLTIVAIGTSLPELVTSVVATKKGETSIAIGNVIGSNLFNILFILGVSGLCHPISIQTTAIYDTILLLVISIVLYMIGKKGHFNRIIGIGMIIVYVGYTIGIIIR